MQVVVCKAWKIKGQIIYSVEGNQHLELNPSQDKKLKGRRGKRMALILLYPKK
jgi:hypothetical protein